MTGLLLTVAVLGGAAYLVLRGIRAFELGRGRPADLEELRDEIEGLREQQDRLGSRVSALREGKEFADRLSLPLLFLSLFGTVTASAQVAPEAPDTAELRAVTTRGRMLAEYDRASWHGTDAVRARMPRPVGVEGLIAVRSSDGRWRVLFGRLSEGKDSLIVVARAVQTTRADSFQATIHEGTELGDEGERRAFRALQTAGADLQGGPVPHNGPYNSYVLARPAGGWWVYFLPAQVQRGVYPHGGDFRYVISADGAAVVEKFQMHRTVLMSQVPPDGTAGFHTSIVSGTPVDSDVFLVLTRQPAKPELVATQHFHYEIRTDGSISWQPATTAP